MKLLEGKNILFISVRFFGYENAIVECLKKHGANVDFFDDRPANSYFTKGLIRYNKNLLKNRIQAYYQNILKKIDKTSYDYFLLIKGEAVPHDFLIALRNRFPKMKMIFYSFDAMREYPFQEKLLSFFDEVFTFEPDDAKRLGIHLRPLFALENYRQIKHYETKYDISFIGTAHTDRYIVGELVKSEAQEMGLRTFFYYFAMGKLVFLLRRLFDKELQKFDVNSLNYRKLSHVEIKKIYDVSFTVLDINKPFQKGLTMRTFEVLCSGRKLITTNEDIKHYPFYNPQNIMILCRQNISLDKSFFESPFQNIDEEQLRKMSIDSFVECLFIQHQDEYWLNNYQ